MKIVNPISANNTCKSNVCILPYVEMALSGFIPRDIPVHFFSFFSGLFLWGLMFFWQKNDFLTYSALQNSPTYAQINSPARD
jgi:hypothetical protein